MGYSIFGAFSYSRFSRCVNLIASSTLIKSTKQISASARCGAWELLDLSNLHSLFERFTSYMTHKRPRQSLTQASVRNDTSCKGNLKLKGDTTFKLLLSFTFLFFVHILYQKEKQPNDINIYDDDNDNNNIIYNDNENDSRYKIIIIFVILFITIIIIFKFL